MPSSQPESVDRRDSPRARGPALSLIREKYLRIVADKAGETHRQDGAFAYRSDVMAKDVPSLHRLSLPKGEGLFMHTEGNKTFCDLLVRNPPRRMRVIQLTGSREQTASDGNMRIVNRGEMLIAEDVAGRAQHRIGRAGCHGFAHAY